MPARQHQEKIDLFQESVSYALPYISPWVVYYLSDIDPAKDPVSYVAFLVAAVGTTLFVGNEIKNRLTTFFDSLQAVNWEEGNRIANEERQTYRR